MKKITLLLAMLVGIFAVNAQETISFETDEGYSLGNIHNQNNWVSTGYTDADGNPANIENQVVTNELASDGTYSFKIDEEPDFGPQENGPVIGGFYEYTAPVEYTDAVLSFDVYVDGVTGGSDFRFAAVGEDVDENGEPAMFFVSFIDFDFENNIRIVDSAGEFANIGTYEYQTWYNVRFEIDNSNVTYYIDDVEIGSSVLLSEIDITEFRFVADNYGGAAYIDNFQTNEPLSNNDFETSKFTHFYKDGQLGLEASETIDNVSIFNMLGQEMLNTELSNSNGDINVSSFNNGMYITKVTIGDKTETFKFIKK